MKEKVIDNISIEEMVKEIQRQKDKIIEDFSKAYIADTGLKPSEVVLVERRVTKGTEIINEFYFKKKEDDGPQG